MKLGVQISKVTTHRLELIVRKYDSDSKSSTDVFANQGFELFEYVGFMLSSLPADPNLMFLDIVIRHGISATFMMSADRVTFLYCCIMETGIEMFSTLTFGDICCTDFSFTQPRSGPEINFYVSNMLYGGRAVWYHVHANIVNIIISRRPPYSPL